MGSEPETPGNGHITPNRGLFVIEDGLAVKPPADPKGPSPDEAHPAKPQPDIKSLLSDDELAGKRPTIYNGPLTKEEKKEVSAAFGLVTQLGLGMFACLFLGVVAGNALDKWLSASPLFLVLFIILGVAAAFKVLYDLVIKRWMK